MEILAFVLFLASFLCAGFETWRTRSLLAAAVMFASAAFVVLYWPGT